jgi:large subunit ribosomal protein L30
MELPHFVSYQRPPRLYSVVHSNRHLLFYKDRRDCLCLGSHRHQLAAPSRALRSRPGSARIPEPTGVVVFRFCRHRSRSKMTVLRSLLKAPFTLQLRAAHNGTAASRTVAALLASPPSPSTPGPNTHFRITLRRSAISLGNRAQRTLAALGLRRRMQTVYHPHTPEAAGMILVVKELVEVQNVPSSAVRTAGQQRAERKAPRGFSVVGSKVGAGTML